MPDIAPARLIAKLRFWTGVFIAGLVLSGITAMPVRWQTESLVKLLGLTGTASDYADGTWRHWVALIRDAVVAMDSQFPFLGYAGDWLAFGHFGIALVFVWAWREPLRYRFLFDYGLLLCISVIPFALICGEFRGIPLGWRAVDCGFGVIGMIPLARCRGLAKSVSNS